MTEHTFGVIMCVVNQETWNDLPSDLQEILTEVYMKQIGINYTEI